MTQDQIRASFQIKENSITPNLIDYSGSAPTDEQSLVYDAGADKFKWTTISGASPQGTTVASGITTDTTNFNSRLTVLDNTVQKALDTLDDHTHTILPSVTVTGTLTTNGNTTIGGNMLMDSNRLELSTVEAGDYSTTLFKKSSTPSLGSIFQLESLAPSGTLAGGTSTKLVAGIDGFLDSGEVYVSMNDSGVRSFYVNVDKTYLEGSIQLYNTALPDTPNANNGTIYVQSGVLKFRDDTGTVTDIVPSVGGGKILPLDDFLSVGSGDDFGGTSLDVGWSSLQSTGLTSVDASVDDFVILKNTSNTADKDRGIQRAFTPAGDFTVTAKMNYFNAVENYQWSGIFVGAADPSDGGSGNRLQNEIGWITGVYAWLVKKVAAGTGTNVFNTSVVTLGVSQSPVNYPVWLSIRRAGSTLYFGISFDGVQFFESATTTTIAFTVETVGIFLGQNVSTLNPRATFDYIKTSA